MTEKNDKAERLEKLKTVYTETEKVILSRRSVRLYKKEQVPEFMVKRILEAGRFAPSAGNAQPWKFVVIRDPEIINGMTKTVVMFSKIFRAMLDYRRPGFKWLRPSAKLSIRLLHRDLHPIPFTAIPLIADEKLGLWHGAPTVIILFKDVRGVANPDLDCGIAGQNMVLAAHSMGLGTCWVGFATLAFDYIPNWYKRLGISYPYKYVNSIAIGWPQGEPDGMIARQTHAVDWYEDGMKKTLYASKQKFSAWEKFRIPTYNDPKQIQFGEVDFDYEKCTGCSICARTCPAKSIIMENKKPIFKDECMFCGCCAAICPVGAIYMKTPYRYTNYFKNIDHGPISPPKL